MGRESIGVGYEPPKIQIESIADSNFGDKKTPTATKEKRSPLEIMDLRDKMRFAAKILSSRHDLKVLPGKGWKAGLPEAFNEERRKNPQKKLTDFDPALLTPDVITFPEKDLVERSEDYVWGVLRHEISHIKHSDYYSLIDSQDKVRAEGYQNADFFTIYDGWEDCRSNETESRSSEAAKFQLGCYLKEDLLGTVLDDIEKMPLPIQYSALCWAKGSARLVEGFNFDDLKKKITDEKVLKAFEETEEVLESYVDEKDGRKAYEELLWKKAWPIFKELIDKQIDQDAKEGAKQKSRTWDDLTPEEQEELKEAARKKLTEQEEEFIKPLQPKSVELKEKEDGTVEIIFSLNPEDVKKIGEEESIFQKEKDGMKAGTERAKQAEAEKLKKEADKLKEREDGFTKEQQDKYTHYFADVKKYVNLLVEKLDDVFPSTEEGGWEGGKTRGKRVDRRRLAREMPTGRGKAFEARDVPEVEQSAFSLLFDVSGSMESKVEEVVRAGILFSEAFSKKGVPFEMTAFNLKLWKLKEFDEPYNGKTKLNILKVLELVKMRGPNQGNDDGFAVDGSARRLQKRLLSNDARGALIVFSDGMPAPTLEHSGEEWDLKKIVEKWSKQIPLIGVGIGPGMEETILEYYGKNGLPVPDVHQLPRALLKILMKQIARFE